eukprot:c19759_g1_i5.p1 GENE.c19759_g1_i5~~c19759_g1_i5.p1  ORF type:complete len:191 (+),score=37.60 c19759_g1_i5:445-1017(+)
MLEDTMKAMQRNAEYHELELCGYRDNMKAAHQFMEQMSGFAQELKIVPSISLVQSDTPNYDEAIKVVRTMFRAAQDSKLQAGQSESVPRITFQGGDCANGSLVIFERTSPDRPFVALGSHANPGLLSDETRTEIAPHLSPQTRFVVGVVVERILLTAETPNVLGLARGASYTSLRVNVMQIDDVGFLEPR